MTKFKTFIKQKYTPDKLKFLSENSISSVSMVGINSYDETDELYDIYNDELWGILGSEAKSLGYDNVILYLNDYSVMLNVYDYIRVKYHVVRLCVEIIAKELTN